MKIKEFKIRCSAIGSIVGNRTTLTDKQAEELVMLENKPKRTEKQEEKLQYLIKKRDTPPELSQTAKSYCDVWLKEQIYHKRKQFSSKYTAKGLIVEDEGIDLISEMYFNSALIIKNEDYFENEFMTGTPDIILPDEILDNKSSWDCFTFPLTEDKINKDYEWQLKGYMELVRRKKARLIYTLINTPQHLIDKEAYYLSKDLGIDLKQVKKDLTEQKTYDNTPKELRVKSFNVYHDENDIEWIKNRVLKCREYIKDQLKKIEHEQNV